MSIVPSGRIKASVRDLRLTARLRVMEQAFHSHAVGSPHAPQILQEPPPPSREMFAEFDMAGLGWAFGFT
eukprot:5000408-Amphidinium_carterae.1